ncbi:hypothetical protein Baya_16987 [Bagarius yarrelli]|uniref:Uncharacterized protein n=1 Tax=Bagarius yarrelli TaxID=175774 RepID=A0A556VX24_BAGYA|nr:hypothetical protein Baya_16987 [Bagarius yarrelli]
MFAAPQPSFTMVEPSRSQAVDGRRSPQPRFMMAAVPQPSFSMAAARSQGSRWSPSRSQACRWPPPAAKVHDGRRPATKLTMATARSCLRLHMPLRPSHPPRLPAAP